MKNYEQNIQSEIKKLEELGIKIEIKVEPDIEKLDVKQLEEYLNVLENRLEKLEENEPDDDSSDEYDEWKDKYDTNEELVEEVTERLQELREQ